MIWPFDKGLVSTKIDVWLNGQALFDPVFKSYLNDLKINMQIKATEGITGLIRKKADIQQIVWHLDVGLSFPNSVLLLGSYRYVGP